MTLTTPNSSPWYEETIFQIWWRSVHKWRHNLDHRRRTERHVKVILYSIQRYALHWTDKNLSGHKYMLCDKIQNLFFFQCLVISVQKSQSINLSINHA